MSEKWYGKEPQSPEAIAQLQRAWDQRQPMHTFDYVIHRVDGGLTGVLCVCAICFEVRFLYGPDREHDYRILNHSELVPCTGGAVYLQRGQQI